MKKIIALTSTFAVLAAASASAKTEGNYLALDLHRAVTQAHNDIRTGTAITDHIDKRYDQQLNFGASYKYAFNFDKLFVAPGVFFERIGTNTRIATGENNDDHYFRVRNRHGVKVDVGYDITDNFAAYLTGGLSYTGYKTNHSDANGQASPQVLSGSKPGFLWGFGAMQKINDNFSVGAEYNTQRLSVKGLLNDTGSGDVRIKSTIDVYKLVVAYHF